MNDRPNPLLLGSAILYFVGALALLFAPREILRFVGAAGGAGWAAVLQVLGSALFGFAMLNWASRYSRIGGIYGRPLVMANLAHAGTAFLLLVRVAIEPPFALAAVVPTIAYGALAVAFGSTLFRTPKPR